MMRDVEISALKDALIEQMNNVNILLYAVEKTDCGHPSCLDRAQELSNRIRGRTTSNLNTEKAG